MIYVDTLLAYGNVHGHTVWAHLGTSDLTPEGVETLHAFAQHIRLKRAWFQDKPDHPHYDVTPGKHALALKRGAKQVTRQEFVQVCAPALWARVMARIVAPDASSPVKEGTL